MARIKPGVWVVKSNPPWWPFVLAAITGWQSQCRASIDLASAEGFAVIGGSAVTSTGETVVTGDMGCFPSGTITGFGPGVVTGTTYLSGAIVQQAHADATAAYTAIISETSGQNLTGDNLGGLTLLPGVMSFSSSAQLTGTLILNAQGNPNAQFIFQIGSTLTTASDANIELINGAQADNIYWQVGSSATIGTGSVLFGNVLADTSITMNTGSSLTGRAMALNGAVTLDDSSVSISSVPEPNTLWAGVLCFIALGAGKGLSVWRSHRRRVA
jgi:type VI secretion system secreted protein VgrG